MKVAMDDRKTLARNLRAAAAQPGERIAQRRRLPAPPIITIAPLHLAIDLKV
jgi:hypothetical protein